MKKLSKLWLDLFFCCILIFLTGNTYNYLPKNDGFSQKYLPSKLVNVSENN